MLFSFSPMAFDDIAWFVFDFTKALAADDYIIGTPTVTVGSGVTIVDNSVTPMGSPPRKVIVKITAGYTTISTVMSCTIITNNGFSTTRSGVVPVVAVVPN